MKKIVSLFLLMLLSLTTLFSGCGDPDPDNGGDGEHQHEYVTGFCECGEFDQTYLDENLVFKAVTDGYEVETYLGNATKIIIPSTYEGGAVVSIGESAFEGLNFIKNVYISDSVKTIKAKAFNGCSGLKGIYVGKGVESIGALAFADCYSVTKFTFNAVACNDLKNNQDQCFRAMGAQTYQLYGLEVYFGKDVTRVPAEMFYVASSSSGHNPRITSITFADDSECLEIGDVAFNNLRVLTSINFGKNSKLQRIGDSGIAVCTSLKTLTIPASVRVIEKYALGSLNSLETVVVEDPTNWMATKINSSTGEVLMIRELPQDKLTDPEIAFVYFTKAYAGGCFLYKAGDPLPASTGVHQHRYNFQGVTGLCRCYETNENHVHEYENGVCVCRAVISSHVHDFANNGLCACRQTNESHVHEYDPTFSVCACGYYSSENYLESIEE